MSKVWIDNPGGSGFFGCECIKALWPEITKEAIRRGIVKRCIDVSQGSYNQTVKASAKTHWYGGVLDLRQYSQALDDLLEEYGIAGYVRTVDDGFSPHIHMLVIGCPHLHWQAANQVTAWRNGRNGLANNRADRDRTRPSIIRTWAQALEWQRKRVAQTAVSAAMQTAPAYSFSGLMNGITGAGKGRFNGNLRLLQMQLNRRGMSRKVLGRDLILDGIWGDDTQRVVRGYQLVMGFTGRAADGVPGRTSTTAIMSWARNPYRVIA